MIFLNYLKRSLFIYGLCGIMLAIFLFTFILSTKIYTIEEGALSSLRNSLTTMRVLKKENDMLKKRIEEVRSLLPSNYDDRRYDYQLLKTIDDIKKGFPGFILTVEDFSTGDFIMSIPFRINGELQSYTSFVKGLNQIENRIIPSVRINTIRIDVTEDKLTNVHIGGEVRIPVIDKGGDI